MIKLFEYLYYSIYRVFKLIKRVGVKDEDLASSFFSILLYTNTGMLVFLFKFVLPKDCLLQNPLYLIFVKLAYILVFVFWYFFCKNYFLKKGNYLRIVSFYENKYEGKNNQMAIIGICYSLFTFSSFIGLAMWLSRI